MVLLYTEACPGKVYNYLGEGYQHPPKRNFFFLKLHLKEGKCVPQPPHGPLEVSRGIAASVLLKEYIFCPWSYPLIPERKDKGHT